MVSESKIVIGMNHDFRTSPNRVGHPQRPRRRTTRCRRRNWPPASGGTKAPAMRLRLRAAPVRSRGAHDGPRRVAVWPVVRRGRGTGAGAACHVWPTARWRSRRRTTRCRSRSWPPASGCTKRQPCSWAAGCAGPRAAALTMAISSGGAADGASRRGHGCWRGWLVARGVRGARLPQALGRGHPFEWRARAVDEGPVLHSASSPIGSSPPSGRYWSAARKQQFRGTVRVVDKLYHGVVSLERFLCELTMPKPLPRRAAANPTQYNVDAIAKLEHDALGRRTLTERVSDVITKLVGNTGFLLAQLLLICGWSLINLRVIPGVRTFDPFPFGGLALVISCESVFLTIFVLISQGRMARQSERRSHLDLQVGMLSEQELTTILQMLQKLCQHMGVDVGSSEQEVQSFSKTTDVHKLASELEEKLPEK